ncbi:hypothetical protein ABKN59_008697 [Abortiporus biennis]
MGSSVSRILPESKKKSTLATGLTTARTVPTNWSELGASPTKRGYPAKTRRDIEKSYPVQSASLDPDFLFNHLPLNPPSLDFDDAQPGHQSLRTQLAPLIAEITTETRKVESKLYKPFCKFLTILSEAVYHGVLDAITINSRDQPKYPIIFLDHHSSPPRLHPFAKANTAMGDIVDVSGPRSRYRKYENKEKGNHKKIPYPVIDTIAEAKTILTASQGCPQAITYTCEHLEARPDKPGVYALSASPSGYQVIWSDPGGVKISPQQTWDLDNMPLLIGYLQALYTPPSDHITIDPSIKFSLESTGSSPFWTIRCSNSKTYSECYRIIASSPWGDRTNVWQSGEGSEAVLIKEVYHHRSSRFREDVLLFRIHSKGLVPGVAQAKHTELVSVQRNGYRTPIKTVSEDEADCLEKWRMVLSSTGEQMTRAKSLKDFLMAFYDLSELHRWLANEPDIQHNHDQYDKELVSNPPRFIDTVLNPSTQVQPSLDTARCLLFDFHNGAALNPSDISPIAREANALVPKTGSCIFTARAISIGEHLTGSTLDTNFSRMPELSGEAKRLYIKAYGKTAYHRYCDNATTYHGRKFSGCMEPTLPFGHRMDHDAEALFWFMVYCLLRFRPSVEGSKDSSAHLDLLQDVWQILESHRMVNPDTTISDARSELLTYTVRSWAKCLHPDLHACADLIHEMRSQILPEYALLDSPPEEDHLHEAIRRLLLEHIVNMGEDIKLNPDALRPVTGSSKSSQDDSNAPAAELKKRKRGTADTHEGEAEKKRNRIRRFGTEEFLKVPGKYNRLYYDFTTIQYSSH